MGLQRQKIRAAGKLRSQRRLWFRLSHNEQSDRKDVCGKEILLEQKNTPNNKDKKA